MTEFSTKEFIQCVRDRPVIYKTGYPDYKSKSHEREKGFEEIAKIMNMDVNLVRVKWKSLRDNYSKYLRTQHFPDDPKVQTIKKYKQWPWAQQMSFLKNFLPISKMVDPLSDLSDVTTVSELDSNQFFKPQEMKPLFRRRIRKKTSRATRNDESESRNVVSFCTVNLKQRLPKQKQPPESSELTESCVETVVEYLDGLSPDESTSSKQDAKLFDLHSRLNNVTEFPDISRSAQKIRSRNVELLQTPNSKSESPDSLDANENCVETIMEYVDEPMFYNIRNIDDVDLICLGYARTIKQLPAVLQAKVKFGISKLLMEAELEAQSNIDAATSSFCADDSLLTQRSS